MLSVQPSRLFAPFFALALLAACSYRSPFPPALGSGQVRFQESSGVHVTVAECTRVATYTVALRTEIERAGPVAGDDLVLIFHDGSSEYLGRSGGRGYAMVRCEDWGSIAGIVEEHNRESRHNR